MTEEVIRLLIAQSKKQRHHQNLLKAARIDRVMDRRENQFGIETRVALRASASRPPVVYLESTRPDSAKEDA